MQLPPVVVRSLKNGLRVVLVERHEVPVVDFVLVVPGGGASNPVGKAGCADLMGQMLVAGTRSRTSLDIDDQVAFLGAHLSVNSGWDATMMSLSVPVAQMDEALELFADVVLHPVFPEEEFVRVQQERLTALVQLNDYAPAIADRMYAEVLYGRGHPYGQPMAGTDASVREMTVEDVKSLYNSQFDPKSASLIVVGDVVSERIVEMLEGLFGEWDHCAGALLAVPEAQGPASTVIYVIDKPGAEQSSFRIGTVGVARTTPEYFPLTVMNMVLGGTFTSRLNQNLRETKGFTYGAGSRFEMRVAAGPFTARSEIVGEETDVALLEFLKELRGIRELVPEGELLKAKRFLELQLPSRFETTSEIAQQLAMIALYGLPWDYYNRYTEQVERVTDQDVQRVALRYVDPERVVVLIVGDRQVIGPKLEALQIAAVSVRDVEGNFIS